MILWEFLSKSGLEEEEGYSFLGWQRDDGSVPYHAGPTQGPISIRVDH